MPGRAAIRYTIPISQSTPKIAVLVGGRFGCDRVRSGGSTGGCAASTLMAGSILHRCPTLRTPSSPLRLRVSAAAPEMTDSRDGYDYEECIHDYHIHYCVIYPPRRVHCNSCSSAWHNRRKEREFRWAKSKSMTLLRGTWWVVSL